jgi:hypothetical protein
LRKLIIKNKGYKIMNKYVILVNGGLYGGGYVFDRDELDDVFEEWSEGEVMMSEEGEEISIDDLISYGGDGERVNIVNESMVEMSDMGGWVEVSVVKLNFREGEE